MATATASNLGRVNAAAAGAAAGSLNINNQDPTQIQARADNASNHNEGSTNSNIAGKGNGTAEPNTTRVSNTTICVPIVYGSIAFPLKKHEEYNTHRWTLFLRGARNEDLADGIAKVVFQLHPSFAQPVRELTAPPFEVTEKGWGEFEASIRVVWRDPTEKALVLTHFIKLYPPIDNGSGSNKNSTGGGSNSNSGGGRGGSAATSAAEKKDAEPEPVISQFYDEVVFTDPTETFHRQLLHGTFDTKNSRRVVQSQEPTVQNFYEQPTFSDDSDFKILLEAQRFLEEELVSVKDRILRAESNKAELENALMEVSNKAKAVAAQAAAAAAASSAAAATSTSTGTKRKSKSSGGSSKKSKSSSSKKQSMTTNTNNSSSNTNSNSGNNASAGGSASNNATSNSKNANASTSAKANTSTSATSSNSKK